MIISDDKQLVVYNDDYKPVNVFGGRKKIAGYKEENYTGKHIEVEDTYNDVLDVAVQGHHEQDSRNAVWWNQLAEGLEDDTTFSVYGASVIYNNGVISINGTATGSGGRVSWKILCNITSGHKYCIASTLKGLGYVYFTSVITASNYQGATINTIFTAGDKINGQCRIGFNLVNGTVYDTTGSLFLVDLTAMFGEGKEPTIEQFRKMYPCDYYPYCAGEWRYANKGQWVDFNQGFKHGDIMKRNYLTWDGNIAIINGTFPSDTNSYDYSVNSYRAEYIPIVPGHKYLFAIKWLSGRVIKGGIRITSYASSPQFSLYIRPDTTQKENIQICEGRANYPFYRTITADTEIENLRIAQWYVDLTAMFGEGNEPTTVEEFKALYPNEYYEYVESRYEDTGGYYENGQVVEHIPDTAFQTPMPELPEEIRCVENPKIEVGSKGVMWNQIIPADESIYTAHTNSTITTENGFVISRSGSQKNQFGVRIPTILPIDGHKYLVRFKYQSNLDRRPNCRFGDSGNSSYQDVSGNIFSAIRTATDASRYFILWHYDSQPIYNTDDYVCLKDLCIFDLTEMFGAGNEPTTVEEFRAMFPKDYYPYDAGTLKTIQGLHPIVPTTTEIPFKLYGANGINDECEPCVLVDGKWKCRVTRRWKYTIFNAIGWRDRRVDFEGLFDCMDSGVLPNSIPYSTKQKNQTRVTSSVASMKDNDIKAHDKNSTIYIKDLSVVTLDDFKEKNKDTYLLYQLKTPTIELYDPIPVRTLPINSIIDCDAEMEANIKVVDREM